MFLYYQYYLIHALQPFDAALSGSTTLNAVMKPLTLLSLTISFGLNIEGNNVTLRLDRIQTRPHATGVVVTDVHIDNIMFDGITISFFIRSRFPVAGSVLALPAGDPGDGCDFPSFCCGALRLGH